MYKIIRGQWDDGIIVDDYVVSSEYIGEDDWGHPQFNTKRTRIGELLYRMKYNGQHDTSRQIADMCIQEMGFWLFNKEIDCIIPVPPTETRARQPVFLIAKALSQKTGIPYIENVLWKENSIPIKNLKEDKRAESIHIRQIHFATRKCNVLLVDDLYTSGSTANACVTALRQDPLIEKIFFLAIAKTKAKR